MKKVRIIGYVSDICWWQGHLGDECEVLDYYEPTNHVQIAVIHKEKFFEDQLYSIKGWLPLKYVEVIE